MAWKRSRVRIPIAPQLYTQVRLCDRSLAGFGLRQLGAESGANREGAAPRPRFGREQREQTCGQIGPDLRLLVRACAQTRRRRYTLRVFGPSLSRAESRIQ